LHFLLTKKSDQRKLFFCFVKKQGCKKAWNGQQEIASHKKTGNPFGTAGWFYKLYFIFS